MNKLYTKKLAQIQVNMNNSTPSSSKRRKTSSPDDDNSILCLANMPHDHLTAIADYLPKSSRALFAVALTAPSKSFRISNWKGKVSDASKAIITSTTSTIFSSTNEIDSLIGYKKERLSKYYAAGWSILDLLDTKIDTLEKKLTDDDIGAVLVCINAKNKLKSLRLDCVDIVGQALEPLCGSKVLESIHFNNSVGKLSANTVVPILDSIVDTMGSRLCKVHELPRVDCPLVLPEEWRSGKAKFEQPLNGFLSKANQMIISESKCEAKNHTDRSDDDENVGHLSCFTCFWSICSHCNPSDDYPIVTCDKCDMTLCTMANRILLYVVNVILDFVRYVQKRMTLMLLSNVKPVGRARIQFALDVYHRPMKHARHV